MDAERLRMERARQRITVRELAEKAGVNPGTISQLERGIREPYPVTVAKIADALGIPFEELVSDPKAGAPPPQAEQQSFNHLLEERRRYRGELGWPDERFHSAVAEAPYPRLKDLVGALVGNRPAPVLEDFGLDRGAATRRGATRAQIFAHALVVRRELLDRDAQDPKEYLPDLRRYLEALDIE